MDASAPTAMHASLPSAGCSSPSGHRDSSTLPQIVTSTASYGYSSPANSSPSTPVSSSTASHSRSASSETTASTGSAYHFILEHLLSYPGTYGSFDPTPSPAFPGRAFGSRQNELPLRSMYTLNSAAAPLSSSGTSTPPSSNGSPTCHSFSAAAAAANNSPTISGNPHRFANEAAVNSRHNPAAMFMSSIMDQIAQIPQQPASLPPAFVTSFLNRCFPIVLEAVDFPQSLTALDYLKDLEMRRRKEIVYALKHHGMDDSIVESAETCDQLAKIYPHLSHYLSNLESKAKRADALYTQLYVALRRWILINEMALTPFNKHNCHAMLNTLYPPVEVSQPSAKLTMSQLKAQREGFFNYIRTVERQGPMCLQTLMQQGAKPGDPNGWPAVKRTLNNYLRLSNSMILESQDISTLESLNSCWNPAPEVILSSNPNSYHAGSSMDSGLALEPVMESAHEQEEEELSKEPRPPSTLLQETKTVELGAEIGRSSPQVPPSSMQTQSALRHKPKVDSGISITADGKHSKQASTSSSKSNGSTGSRIVSGQFSSSSSNPHSSTSTFDFGKGSTLERLTRELKKMSRRRVVADEIIKPENSSRSSFFERPTISPTASKFQLRDRSSTTGSVNTLKTSASMGFNTKPKEIKSQIPEAKSKPSSPTRTRFPGLRKMKSFGDFKSVTAPASNNTNYSPYGQANSTYDINEMKKHREAYEKRHNLI
jgi:hypothetical protein